MTKVRIQSATDLDHVPIAEIDLTLIPRIGERIDYVGQSKEMSYPWLVTHITHEIHSRHGQSVEHVVVITISPSSESYLSVSIEWRNEAERPDWIASDLIIHCDVMPRQGDILHIAVNDEQYETKEAPIIAVEVVLVTHVTLLDPQDRPMGIADQTTCGVIVQNVDQTLFGQMQRVIYAARRN